MSSPHAEVITTKTGTALLRAFASMSLNLKGTSEYCYLLNQALIEEAKLTRVWLERESTFITGLAYNRDAHILFVRIGTLGYAYMGIPSRVADDFIKSASWGTYYNNNIKNNYATYPA